MNKEANFIYQLIYSDSMKGKNEFARSPTLDTIRMIEKSAEKYSGELSKTKLWKKLPKKVMWQTYLVSLDYLQEINKLAIDKNGIIGYIWSPHAAKKFAKHKRINI